MNFWNNIKSALSELSPTCQEASRAQSESLEHPLKPTARIGLWMHLLLCRWCRRYGRQIRLIRRIACEHPEKLEQAAPEKLSADARERIKRQLRMEN